MHVLLVKRCWLVHRFEAMAGAAIPAWVKLKDGESMIYRVVPNSFVSELLGGVWADEKSSLEVLHVSRFGLKLYQSEKAKNDGDEASPCSLSKVSHGVVLLLSPHRIIM